MEERSDRETLLGFKPQKEIIYNTLLPYKDDLDLESNSFLAEIKTNLGRAVQLRDIKVGVGHWVNQLSRYKRLYGLKFSKDDQLHFIHLMYELTVIPDLELSLVHKFASMLSSLLKKKKLLTREDLTIQWRPLYKLVDNVMYNTYDQHGLLLMPATLVQTLESLVRDCRCYFPLESTQEILEELRPLLCPFDVTVIKGLQHLELFLPTCQKPEEMDRGFRLWFDELINMWDSFQNNPSWEKFLISLFARLAHNNVGYIDWSPYVSKVFTRLLRVFNLPVGTQMVQVNRGNYNKVEIEPYITWIVAMMGGESTVQDHIDKLFTALHNFFHPSNLGKWNIKLSSLLMNFPKIFIRRVNRERYREATWMKVIPESHKLTDAEITRFVESMKSTVLMSMFSKYGSQDSAVALRHLSTMRPELIVPPLLEKMYPAMETLIEPHRLIACMNCIVSVSRAMFSAGKWFPEGRLHVLPLLNLSLPGIDPNDFKKCLVTFQMIATFISLVPIVDCSEAIHVRDDLTEVEKELCSATAQFEDFVLLFVDRVFALVENSAQEQYQGALNPEQLIVEKAMASCFTSVLQQCSTPILMSALRRLHNFITGSVYENRVGGRYAANLLRAAEQVNPKETLKMFLNRICNNILELIQSHEEYLTAEQLDDGFLWNLLMLSQLLRCDGSELLPYKEKILEVLPKILRLQCVRGYEIAGKTLMYLLGSLTRIYPLNYRSVPGSVDRPVTEYLAIRDWAKTGDVQDLGCEWHTPVEGEISFAQEVLDTILVPELETVKALSAENQLPREDLLRRLVIILEGLNGVAAAMPVWDGEHTSLIDSQVPLTRFTCANSCGSNFEVTLKGGQNARTVVMDAIRPLLKHMLSCCEDDTKGLNKVLQIYESILFFHGTSEMDFENRWKSFHAVKRALEDKMRGGKKHLRALLVDRVLLQHQMRCLQKTDRSFTRPHQDMLEDLYTLSISRYSEVRKKSQAMLGLFFNHYPYSYRSLLDGIVERLTNSDTPEHQFQGVLYILLGTRKSCIATKRSWEVISRIWPALTQAQQSEKPSILALIDNIINKTVKNSETTAIKLEVNQASIEAAGRLLQSGVPAPTESPCSEVESQSALQFEVDRNEKSFTMYTDLVEKMVSMVKGGQLTWKFSQIALDLLNLLLRHDTPTPPCLVELLTNSCVSDTLYIRKISIMSLMSIQKQMKRKHKKITVDPLKEAAKSSTKFIPGEATTHQQHIPNQSVDCNLSPSDSSLSSGGDVRGGEIPPHGTGYFRPGYRADNVWHTYNSKDLPDTQEKWEGLSVIEKTHWGYYSWPKDLKTYAPKSEQPKLNRDRQDLTEGEKIIYDAFTNPEFVTKLVDFLALEENKGRDKFGFKKMVLFKGLFRNFGDSLLPSFKPHIERLISDTSHDKHDSSHRCAMEIMSGIIRGSKHWSYTQTVSLWAWLKPLLKNALNNLTDSTLKDWCTFFSFASESRDPRKTYWFYELVMDNPLSGEGGSFGDAGRLSMLQNALLQQEWRVGDLHSRLLSYLTPHLAHIYKIVRDRIGCLLSDVFILDYKMFPTSQTRGDSRREFIDSIMPTLNKLQDLVIEEARLKNGNGGSGENSPVRESASSGSLETGVEQMDIEVDGEESEERKDLTRLCKTVMKCAASCINRTFFSAPREIVQLLPIMCTLESEAKDEELKMDCQVALACLAQALIQPDVIPHILHTVKQVTGLQSWHARSAVLSYVQVAVFCNYFILQDPAHKETIRETVMHLICDDKLEVREMASVTLSGLLQCGYLEMDQDLLDHFERLSATKIKKRVKSESVPMEKIIQRHAGVLGLCAYVQAYPYHVPAYMPQILMDLSSHVNDPQPIQMTVKKTLSNFRRTHHDNWHDHKLMFTDDQLVILTDLLVSPNYYA
ncbi:proteasome activator complex subunit 4A-like [Mya arenaria]|uniref:proteasome activator complex subunit 4A-like n=1 Tax=Mya arenaria TaxID=6604 RepID=UPI0022E975A0|nr:proteasome activator complex subunit 4A-like [Mya arenaria]